MTTAYTYYQPVKGMVNAAGLLDYWTRSWQAAGFKTKILSENDAVSHPGYGYFIEKISKFPTSNPKDYERACFVRHLAMANTPGANLLVDYDVIPNPKGRAYKLDLPRGIICLEPTRVPCAMWGTPNGFEDVCDFICEYDGEFKQHVSDMTILREQTALPVANPPIVVEHLCSGREIPNDPGQGWKEAPFIHFSNFSFNKLGWGGDKVSLIRRAMIRL